MSLYNGLYSRSGYYDFNNMGVTRTCRYMPEPKESENKNKKQVFNIYDYSIECLFDDPRYNFDNENPAFKVFVFDSEQFPGINRLDKGVITYSRVLDSDNVSSLYDRNFINNLYTMSQLVNCDTADIIIESNRHSLIHKRYPNALVISIEETNNIYIGGIHKYTCNGIESTRAKITDIINEQIAKSCVVAPTEIAKPCVDTKDAEIARLTSLLEAEREKYSNFEAKVKRLLDS